MKLMVFVLNLAFTFSAVAAINPVTGTISRVDKRIYISGDKICDAFLASATNKEAAISLNKLANGDVITASGSYDVANCTVSIASIDYVGLKRLLGHWYAADGMLAVTNFNSLEFYPFNIVQGVKPISLETSEPIRYRYSVTPANGRDWIMFLSDSKNTTFASLQVNSKNASLRIYDSETGEPIQTLRFSKWGDLK